MAGEGFTDNEEDEPIDDPMRAPFSFTNTNPAAKGRAGRNQRGGFQSMGP